MSLALFMLACLILCYDEFICQSFASLKQLPFCGFHDGSARAAAAAAAAAGGARRQAACWPLGDRNRDHNYDGVLYSSRGGSWWSLAAGPPPNSPPERAMLRL